MCFFFLATFWRCDGFERVNGLGLAVSESSNERAGEQGRGLMGVTMRIELVHDLG